jgi:SAM-dependent methyltransferase
MLACREEILSNQLNTNGALYQLLPNFARIHKFLKETRSPDRLLAHYTFERQLSDRLRRASREERRTLYTEVYSELLASLPDHPQNCAARSNTQERVDAQMRTIVNHPDPGYVFLEVGCGSAALAFAIAPRVSIAYAMDVTDALVDFAKAPSNFHFVHTNGVEIPLDTASIDIAYSNQLMEHLHPDDASDQLKEIYRVLKPGGRYICITPSRLTGPHDISCYFDHEARGFHLREYDYSSLSALFKGAGFGAFRCYIWAQGWQIRIPYPIMRAVEFTILTLPPQIRALLTRSTPLRRVMGLNAIGVK